MRVLSLPIDPPKYFRFGRASKGMSNLVLTKMFVRTNDINRSDELGDVVDCVCLGYDALCLRFTLEGA
jgi:hypothetical protein